MDNAARHGAREVKLFQIGGALIVFISAHILMALHGVEVGTCTKAPQGPCQRVSNDDRHGPHSATGQGTHQSKSTAPKYEKHTQPRHSQRASLPTCQL